MFFSFDVFAYCPWHRVHFPHFIVNHHRTRPGQCILKHLWTDLGHLCDNGTILLSKIIMFGISGWEEMEQQSSCFSAIHSQSLLILATPLSSHLYCGQTRWQKLDQTQVISKLGDDEYLKYSTMNTVWSLLLAITENKHSICSGEGLRG